MSHLSEDPALSLAKKAISLVNNLTVQTYSVSQLLESRDNSASCVYIHANGGTAETIKIHADQGTSDASINVVSDAGGITLNASSDVVVTNTLVYKSPVTAVTTTKTVATTESGTIFSVSQDSSYVITLPAAAAGLRYTFICSNGSANSVTIVTNSSSNHMYGSVFSSAGTHSNQLAGDTITLGTGTEIGDVVDVIGLSSSVWCIRGFCKSNAAIAISQASA